MKNLIFADISIKIKVFMKQNVYWVLLLMGFIQFGCSQTIQEGMRHLENENYNAALETFNKMALNEPKNSIYPYQIGEVYYAMDNPVEARKAYNKGLSINSNCDECHVGLGRLDLDENKVGEANKHFQTALKGNLKNAGIQVMVGMGYLYNKNPMPEAALEFFTRARDLDPKQSKYWIYLGDTYLAKGDNGNAMTSYETAVEKDKNDPETYVKMGRIWAKGQQMDLAIEKLEKAIQLKPDYALAYKDLYQLYIRAGKLNKVVPILEKYVSLSGTDVDAKVRLVKFLSFQAKDYSKAVEEGTKLLVSNPEQYTLYRWLAWSNFETGNYQTSLDQSFQLFEEIKKDTSARKSYPSDYEYAAKAAAKLNMMDTAEMFFARLMNLQPEKTGEYSVMMAKAFYDAKKYDKAEYWYLEKEKSSPLSVTELVYLGLTQKNLGKFQLADTSYAKILELSPKYEFGWYTRAQIKNDLDPDKKLFLAKPFYEKFIELATASPDATKWKSKLVDAYLYMVYYTAQNNDFDLAKSYSNLVLNLDPENENAKEYLKILSGDKKR